MTETSNLRNLVWFKNDLRVTDHPALSAAAGGGKAGGQGGAEVVACFCVSVQQWRSHGMGDWRLAFLLRSVHALQKSLQTLNIPLLLVDAPTFAEVPAALADLAGKLAVDQLHFVDEYPLDERRRDDAVAATLAADGISVVRHTADVLVKPGDVLSGQRTPLTVFTPFYRKWLAPAEAHCRSTCDAPQVQTLASVEQRPLPEAVDGVHMTLGADLWPAGEAAAAELLDEFVSSRLDHYGEARDVPSLPGTSRLSAHLAVGSVSPRQCMQAAQRQAIHEPDFAEGAQKWISELAWRDFYRHIAAAFDHVSFGYAFRREMDQLPWRQAPEELAAWQAGSTGYPFVDAAMRQLNATGWMHNRLRMVAAMFLTKHLLIDWREGERYFMSRLVDGDFASNNGGWQWSASTGTDAAPYFRIFNPASQGTRFDAAGVFTRHWLPELRDVPPKYLFEPSQAGVQGYPAPIVEHKFARERALAFFKANM